MLLKFHFNFDTSIRFTADLLKTLTLNIVLCFCFIFYAKIKINKTILNSKIFALRKFSSLFCFLCVFCSHFIFISSIMNFHKGIGFENCTWNATVDANYSFLFVALFQKNTDASVRLMNHSIDFTVIPLGFDIVSKCVWWCKRTKKPKRKQKQRKNPFEPLFIASNSSQTDVDAS